MAEHITRTIAGINITKTSWIRLCYWRLGDVVLPYIATTRTHKEGDHRDLLRVSSYSLTTTAARSLCRCSRSYRREVTNKYMPNEIRGAKIEKFTLSLLSPDFLFADRCGQD